MPIVSKIYIKPIIMGIILVTFILIATVAAVSLILIKLSSKHKTRERAELINRFRQLALDRELSIHNEEILENLAIGFDKENRKLLVLKKVDKNNYDSIVIDLDEIRSSEKTEIYGKVDTEKAAVLRDLMQLERIVLTLQFEDDREPVEISFYDFMENSIYEIEVVKEKVKRWETVLSSKKTPPGQKNGVTRTFN